MKKIGLCLAFIGMAVSQNLPNTASNFLPTLSNSNSLSLESVKMLSQGTEPLIGGGLHDIINLQSLQTLERWALTVEAHHTMKTGKALIGGIHGRKLPLTKEEYAQYILDMANIHKELNNAERLDQLSLSYGIITNVPGEDSNTKSANPLIGGDLHDILRLKDLESLKVWALTLESYHNAKTGMVIIGGIHGRKEPLTKEEYSNYIVDMTNLYPNLKNPRALDQLSISYGFANSSLLQFGGLHDFLLRQDINILEKWALAAEAHHNAKTGMVIIGGIHGRKEPLTKVEFAQYIMDMSRIYPELNSASKLDELTVTYGIQAPQQALQIGGLHDFIFRESKENLEKWANTVEAHHIKVTGKPIIGGIHGRRDPLTNEEYAQYILDMTKIYPGLNSRSELDRLSVVYGFSDSKITKQHGGLHDYLYRQPRETLIRWALTAEEHLKQKTGQNLIGGIRGRLIPLSNQEYAEYVLRMAEKFPELDNGQELDRLSQVYGLADNPTSHKIIGGMGGLHDYIYRTERNTLIKWALTAEAHDRKAKNVHLLGGLAEYINSLSNEEIAEYILRMADTYQELNSKENLESFAVTYEINKEKDVKKVLKFLN